MNKLNLFLMLALSTSIAFCTSAHAAQITCDEPPASAAPLVSQMMQNLVQELLDKLPEDGRISNPFAKRPIRYPREVLIRLKRYFSANRTVCLSILLKGEINPGDYEKVRSLINEGATKIDLISRGGDLVEAMKIGRLLHLHLIKTQAPTLVRDVSGRRKFVFLHGHGSSCGPQSNCVCASACFFVWAGGIEREGTAIGLHRPSFNTDYQGTAAKAELQYERAIWGAREYLEQMEVPTQYIDLMLRTKSSEIVFIGALKAGGYDIDEIEGYIPSMDEWLDTYCDPIAPGEISSSTEYIEKENCRTAALFIPRMRAMMTEAGQ
jgi:hypothetical protein